MKSHKKKISKENVKEDSRQTLRQAMKLLMAKYMRALVETSTVPQTLYCWTNNQVEVHLHPLGLLGPSPDEAVMYVRSILKKRRPQQAIVVDLIHTVEQPLLAPIKTPIKNQPGSVEAIVIVGANKHEAAWMLQPFYRTDKASGDVVFDDSEEGTACLHP